MKTLVTISCCLLLLFACTSAPSRSSPPIEPRSTPPTGPPSADGRPSAASGPERPRDSSEPSPLEGLTLEGAFELAERTHPDLAAAAARVAAARARSEQAGRWPNPEASITAESVPLEGESLGEAEYVLGLSQPLPIGGRLDAATEVADLEVRRAEHESTAVRLEVRSRVRGAFAAMLYAQRATELRRELLAQARELSALAEHRVRLGDEAEAALLVVELVVLDADRELRRAEALLAEARWKLAGALSAPDLAIPSVAGDLAIAADIPTVEEVLRRVEENPLLLAARAGVDAAEARVTRALAERVPDLELQLFYRRIESEDTNAIDLGLGATLPLFDRSRGRVAESRSRELESRAALESTRARLESSARQAHQRLSAAREEERFLEERVLPITTALVDHHEARHDAGDIPLDELIRARGRATSAELARLEAFRETLSAWVEFAPLLAR